MIQSISVTSAGNSHFFGRGASIESRIANDNFIDGIFANIFAGSSYKPAAEHMTFGHGHFGSFSSKSSYSSVFFNRLSSQNRRSIHIVISNGEIGFQNDGKNIVGHNFLFTCGQRHRNGTNASIGGSIQLVSHFANTTIGSHDVGQRIFGRNHLGRLGNFVSSCIIAFGIDFENIDSFHGNAIHFESTQSRHLRHIHQTLNFQFEHVSILAGIQVVETQLAIGFIYFGNHFGTLGIRSHRIRNQHPIGIAFTLGIKTPTTIATGGTMQETNLRNRRNDRSFHKCFRFFGTDTSLRNSIGEFTCPIYITWIHFGLGQSKFDGFVGVLGDSRRFAGSPIRKIGFIQTLF